MKKSILFLSLIIAVSTNQAVFAGGHEHKAAKAHKKFTECAAVRMKEVNIAELARPTDLAKKLTPVPDGWTVVSGAGGEGHPKLLICR